MLTESAVSIASPRSTSKHCAGSFSLGQRTKAELPNGPGSPSGGARLGATCRPPFAWADRPAATSQMARLNQASYVQAQKEAELPPRGSLEGSVPLSGGLLHPTGSPAPCPPLYSLRIPGPTSCTHLCLWSSELCPREQSDSKNSAAREGGADPAWGSQWPPCLGTPRHQPLFITLPWSVRPQESDGLTGKLCPGTHRLCALNRGALSEDVSWPRSHPTISQHRPLGATCPAPTSAATGMRNAPSLLCPRQLLGPRRTLRVQQGPLRFEEHGQGTTS